MYTLRNDAIAAQPVHYPFLCRAPALPERYRRVVQLYYAQEMTMREIGDLIGINESRVSQIHKAALHKMAVTLQAAGIESSTAF